MRALFDSTQSQKAKSEFYMAMCIKTHLNNALYQTTAVCFKLEHEHEHELVIAESLAGIIFILERS